MTPLVAPREYVGRTTRWQCAEFRERRAQWAIQQNRNGYTASAVAAALGISLYSTLKLFRARGHRLRRRGVRRLSVTWGGALYATQFTPAQLDALEVIIERRGYADVRSFFKACVVDGIAEECEELGLPLPFE